MIPFSRTVLLSLMITMLFGCIKSGSEEPYIEYSVGDTGPAGGAIIYDKGEYSDGWQYLEVAPMDASFSAVWGGFGREVSGTEEGIGAGYDNTQLILASMNEFGVSNTAAQMCEVLHINGFEDWFIPSKDELDLIYDYFVNNEKVGAHREWYWSSTQYNDGSVWSQNFADGSQENYSSKMNRNVVRVLRKL